MQNEQRNQRIIEQLEQVWERPYQPSADILKTVTEFAVQLPDKYRIIGLQTIAQNAIISMHIHMLQLLTTFQQKAEQEGISTEDRDETLDELIPEICFILKRLNNNVSVQSLDDMATLINITISLQRLSRSDTADDAQSWLYELPTLYYQRLAEENLVLSTQQVEQTIINMKKTPNNDDNFRAKYRSNSRKHIS